MDNETLWTNLPRNAYFGVVDLKRTGQAPAPHIAMETARRHGLADRVLRAGAAVDVAARAVKSFDKTGNVEYALAHLRTHLADLAAAYEELAADVARVATNCRAQPEGGQMVEKFLDVLDASFKGNAVHQAKPGPR